MTTLSDLEAREAFEAHMRSLNACTRFARQSESVGGQYRTVTVERAWHLWQAALEWSGRQSAGAEEPK